MSDVVADVAAPGRDMMTTVGRPIELNDVGETLPEVNATYCLPACQYVVTPPAIPPPLASLRSSLPLSLSNTRKFPALSPVMTMPPAVGVTPATTGVSE